MLPVDFDKGLVTLSNLGVKGPTGGSAISSD